MGNQVKPTKIWSLAIAAIAAGVISFAIVKAVVANGGSIPVAPKNLLVSIPLIAIAELLIAIPIFRYRSQLVKFAMTNQRPKRVNPFYAVRVVALAKATAISGALFTGFALSLVLLQATLPIIPDSVWQNGVALLESIMLTVAAVVIERFCKLPDDSDSSETLSKPAPEINPA